MCWKLECMKLANLVFFDYFESISEIYISLTRKSDDEIRSYIEYDSVFASYVSELLEYFTNTNTIIMAIHEFQDTCRTWLDREMSIGDDARIFKEWDQLIRTKLHTERWYTESFDLCLFEHFRHKFDKLRLGIVIWWGCSPGTEIDTSKYNFLATTFDKSTNLLDNLLHWSPLMSTTRLNRETKGTEIITSCLYNHIFSREKLFSCYFFEWSDLRLHHGFSFLCCDLKIIRIFREDFYLFSKRDEFIVYLEKMRIYHSISDISTPWKVECFVFCEFWEDFFRMFDPLCFRLISDDTWCDKIPIFFLEMRMHEPFFREVFIRFATEDFVFHVRKCTKNQLKGKNIIKFTVFFEIVYFLFFPSWQL